MDLVIDAVGAVGFAVLIVAVHEHGHRLAALLAGLSRHDVRVVLDARRCGPSSAGPSNACDAATSHVVVRARGGSVCDATGYAEAVPRRNVPLRPVGGSAGCLTMIVLSIVASVVLTVLLNVLVRL